MGNELDLAAIKAQVDANGKIAGIPVWPRLIAELEAVRGELAAANEEREDYRLRLKATAESWRLLSIERDALQDALNGVVVANPNPHPDSVYGIARRVLSSSRERTPAVPNDGENLRGRIEELERALVPLISFAMAPPSNEASREAAYQAASDARRLLDESCSQN